MIVTSCMISCEKSTSDMPETPDSEIVEPELKESIELKFVVKNLAKGNSTTDVE